MSPGIETSSRFGSRLAVLLIAAAALIGACPSDASSVRVPADFYGVNFQRIKDLGPYARELQLKAIVGLGARDIRFNVSWAAIEPLAPTGGTHSYRWGAIDDQIAAMARNGVRAQPTITQTPFWDAQQNLWTTLQCAKARSRAPLSIAPYVDLVKAFARRYGRGGDFWQANPSLPAKPVVRYEIWNEPNLKGGWCPKPQPEHYARMFVDAAAAIRAVDPNAEVMTGGVAAANTSNNGDVLSIADFFARAIAYEPQVARALNAAAVHVYPPTDALQQLGRLAWFRSQLRDGGIADSTPMLVNEIGWATRGGPYPVGESDRADAYSRMASNIARTNCNVDGILPHTWTSPEESTDNPEDWYGIADPTTARPYPSALAYSESAKLMRGELATEAPTTTLMACPGMPLPDADRDGVPDENDYYPLDPSRT